MDKKVFISYNDENMAIANGMSEYLDESNCFLHHRDVTPINDNLLSESDQIIEALEKAKYLIFILSKYTCDAKSNLEEIKFASDHNTKIITFKIEDVKPSSELEPYLDKNIWFDALEGSTFTLMQKLEKIISD